MDFLELVTGARTCRRFREAEGMPAGMLDWLIACARVTPLRWKRAGVAVCRCGIPGSLRRRFPGVEMGGDADRLGRPRSG